MDKVYSTKEIAVMFSVKEPTARGWARDGLLRGAFQLGRTWAVPASALEGFSPPRRGKEWTGKIIRFELPAEYGNILASVARQANVTPNEMAKRMTIEALQCGE